MIYTQHTRRMTPFRYEVDRHSTSISRNCYCPLHSHCLAQCRLQSSAQTDIDSSVMGMIQNKITSAVAKVTKENHQQLVSLIEDALSGKGGGGGPGAKGRRGARKVQL